MAVSMGIFILLNLPTFHEEVFTFDSDYKGKPVVLEASYYEAPDAEYAVLICPGYSCDRQKWRPMANLFVEDGLSVMTFDYAGQGASKGTIGFDNAKTDAIPKEIDDAAAMLHEISGIDYDHMILMGHSMGGRAILRLLYDYNDPTAETEVTPKDINSVILFSPEVNYEFSAQASLFAGTSDAEDPIWSGFGADSIGMTNLFIYGSTADDIVSESDVLTIYSRVSGEKCPDKGKYEAVTANEMGTITGVGVTGGVLHSYQMYSPKFGRFANEALRIIDDGIPAEYGSWHFSLIYCGWAFALLGIGCFFAGISKFEGFHANNKHEGTGKDEKSAGNDRGPVLIDSKKYLLHKLLLWIPGLIVAFLLCSLFVVMPFGSPVMNLPYMVCIAGYGLVMLWAYRKGRFKGTEGKLPGLGFKVKIGDGRAFAGGIAICALTCFFVWYVMRATMYRLIPLNFRLFYVLAAAVLMAAGYYVSGQESDMLDRAGASLKVRVLYQLIQYVPLFLLVIFYLAIGSLSGMIGQIQNMVLMYIFCIPLGRFVEKLTGSRILGAMISAFTFQTLMITSAALIAMF